MGAVPLAAILSMALEPSQVVVVLSGWVVIDAASFTVSKIGLD